MGPVITPQSKERVESLIALGERQGAKVLLDGRNSKIAKYESGNFVNPTILDNVPATSDLADTEIFGPCSASSTPTIWTTLSPSSNAAPTAIRRRYFTSSGSAARRFRYEAPPATSASTSESPRPWLLPFQRMEKQLLRRSPRAGPRRHRVLHRQKVVVERWPKNTAENSEPLPCAPLCPLW